MRLSSLSSTRRTRLPFEPSEAMPVLAPTGRDTRPERAARAGSAGLAPRTDVRHGRQRPVGGAGKPQSVRARFASFLPASPGREAMSFGGTVTRGKRAAASGQQVERPVRRARWAAEDFIDERRRPDGWWRRRAERKGKERETPEIDETAVQEIVDSMC